MVKTVSFENQFGKNKFGTRKTKSLDSSKFDKEKFDEEKMIAKKQSENNSISKPYFCYDQKTGAKHYFYNREDAEDYATSEKEKNDLGYKPEIHKEMTKEEKYEHETYNPPQEKKEKKFSDDYTKGKDLNDSELEIKGTSAYTHRMKKHLEKEHPSTRGKMQIEKNNNSFCDYCGNPRGTCNCSTRGYKQFKTDKNLNVIYSGENEEDKKATKFSELSYFKKKEKPEYEYEIMGRYGGTPEVVTTETSKSEAEERLKEYRENERGTAFFIHKKKLNEGFERQPVGYKQKERLPNVSNERVNLDFLHGRSSKSGSLKTKDNKLYSYETPIAEKTAPREITVTNKKYSSTTSKQITKLKQVAKDLGYTVNEKSEINDNKKYKAELKRTEAMRYKNPTKKQVREAEERQKEYDTPFWKKW